MKIFLVIATLLGFICANGAEDINTTFENNETNITKDFVSSFHSVEDNETNVTKNSINTLDYIEINNTKEIVKQSQEENLQIPQKVEKFEKIFANHSAYIAYKKAIDLLYKGEYQEAYKFAIQAKTIYPQPEDTTLMPLAYMPPYLREGNYGAKKVYYKIVEYKKYEVDRLITKIKLLSPPIPLVVIKRTSTYMDISITNYGDLPLDKFELLIDNQQVISYKQILPKEEKKFRVDLALVIHELSFKEEYGFAPESIMVNEGY